MEAMMKKTLSLIAVMLLVGCQSHSKQIARQSFRFPTASEIRSQCESQTSSQVANKDTHLWLCQVVSAIQYRFFDADAYHGKTCDLIITQPLGQPPTNVTAQGGDADLCAVAIDAVKQAIDANTFPMRPAYLKEQMPVRFAP